MAATVNARDVQLQATSPANRVLAVTMASNIAVSQENVTGLGLVVAGTKMVSLTASTQVFQVAKTGTVSPASTVLSADLRNLTNTPVITVTSGTITSPLTLSAGKLTVNYANLTTDTATLRLTVVQDGVTYTDEITIVKVREGIDALVGFLTNESHTVPADYLGNVTNYAGAGGSFKVFSGTSDITALCTFAIQVGGNPSTLAVSLGASTGVFSVTGGMPTSTEVTTLTLTATFGSSVLVKVFSIAKARAGATGAAGTNGTSGSSGVRGSRTFYVPLSGTTGTYSDTLATTTAAVEGGPVMNDLVVQYNNSVGFSQSKFYQIVNSVGSWAVVNAVVDGNLLVSGSVAATHIQANTFTADNVLTRGLTVRDTSGNIILSSGQGLDYTRVGGTKPPSNATFGADSTNLNVGISSGNFISNAGPYPDTADGFSFGYDDTGKTRQPIRASFGAWRPTGQGGVFLEFLAADSPANGTLSDINNGTNRYPVMAGQRYEASVYLSTHRCSAWVNIAWFTAAGVYIGENAGNAVFDNQAQGQLSNFPRTILFATAPANAATASIYVRSSYTGASNPFTFTSMWYFGTALTSQTVASPWSDGKGANWATNVVGATGVNSSITAAQNSANAANDTLANIASDNVLTKGEKPAVILEYATISQEYTGIQNQATAVGVSKVSFDTAIAALQNYLNNTIPNWNNLSVDTIIDGPTFRQKFIDYYVQRQAILNAIAQNANNRLQTRQNLVYNAGFENGFNGWTGATGSLIIFDSVWGRIAFKDGISGTGSIVSQKFQIQAGAGYTLAGDSLMLNATSGGVYFDLVWYNGAGVSLGETGQNVITTNHDFSASDSNRSVHAITHIAPAGATHASVRFVWEAIVGTAIVGVRQVKVERGSLPATPYSADATLPVLQNNANVAATTSLWTGVTGTGRPQDNATVGANDSNLQVGIGSNLIPNSDLTLTSGGWSVGYQQFAGQSFSLTRDLAGDDWRPFSGHNIGLYRSGSIAGSIDVISPTIPAISNARYELSGRIASHRCDADLMVVYLNGSGAYAGEVHTPRVTRSAGGRNLRDWELQSTFFTVPEGVIAMYFAFRTYQVDAGAGDSYTWLTQPMLCRAGAGQTQPSPWSAANFVEQITPANASTYIAAAAIGNAQIDVLDAVKITTGFLSADRFQAGSISASKISTTSLSAITATIGTLRTATSGARMEISDNVLKVFDGNGVKRVQLGNLDL
jgi:hypothetical protein